MGKLIDPERSRRAKQAREKRAKRIFETAKLAFVRDPYSEVTLDSIGQQAGVKQGQASFAFRSREEVFLAVVRSALDQWTDDLEARLTADDETLDAAAAAAMVASSLDRRPDLTRLLGSLHVALELHEDAIEVHRFYHRQRQRLLELADIMAARLPDCSRWEAFDALYRAQLVASAVHPVSRLEGNLALDLTADDHQIFALDLEDEVRRVVVDTLRG
jgi:AcrR family transcriptional regulator